MSFNDQSIGIYAGKSNRYDIMQYRRCGKSGILLSVISVGLWHNFGHADDFTNMRKQILDNTKTVRNLNFSKGE